MKIIMLSNYSNNNKSVFDLTIKNHFDYCAKFNIDLLCTTGKYTPYNNTEEIKTLLQLYDAIITVGTDILFTNFSKDIRDYIDHNYSIIVQQQRNGVGTNGDFIIWNKTKTIFNELDLLQKNKNNFWATQAELDAMQNKLSILVLKPRSIQSINPAVYSGIEAKWQRGDFAVHCHRPGFIPKIEDKVKDLTEFINKYNDILH